jgi:hypothetical protein
MIDRTILDERPLFKQDSARRIDRVIDYFGGAISSPDDAARSPGAADDAEPPSPR